MLNKLRCHAHFQFSANQNTWSRLSLQIHILNDKQCRSRSVGFFRSQLIWIYTVWNVREYSGSAGPGLRFRQNYYYYYFFYLGFTALSRIFHLYRTDHSSKVGENRRTGGGGGGGETTWLSISRTWFSHMWLDRGSNHSGEKPNGLRVNSPIYKATGACPTQIIILSCFGISLCKIATKRPQRAWTRYCYAVLSAGIFNIGGADTFSREATLSNLFRFLSEKRSALNGKNLLLLVDGDLSAERQLWNITICLP